MPSALASPPDLSSTIAQGVTLPSSFSVDGHSVESKPIADLIAADKYLRATYGLSQKHRGLYFTKIVPPDQVGPNRAQYADLFMGYLQL